MKKLVTLFILLGLLALATYAGPAKAPDSKPEMQGLIEQILAAKAAGLTPDPALRARLAELQGQTRHSAATLDQGSDACPATVITSLPYTDAGSTNGLVDDYNSLVCGIGDGPDVIYAFTPTTTDNYVVALCGSYFDTGLYIRTGGSCPGATELACNDDYCGLDSRVTVSMTADTTYYIIVDACCGDENGGYVLNVWNEGVPYPGETCANALPLTIPGTVTGSTGLYLNDYDWVCDYMGSTARDLVYSYTPAVDQSVSFDLKLSDYDTKIYIYDGACSGAPIACSDDFYPTYQSFLFCVPLTAGHTYYIVVDGYGAALGQFVLETTLCGIGSECAADDPQDGRVCRAIGGLILDVTPNTFTIPVPTQYHITDVNVSFDVDHTRLSDLAMWLISPAGTSVALVSREAVGTEMVCTIMDDEASGSLTSEPYSGSYIPYSPLSTFDNTNAAGDWTFMVTDVVDGGAGALNWVCLTFEYDYVLAVELASFTAIPGDGRVTLAWRTASETQNDRFDILRDGETVTQIDATNLATGSSYAWIDHGLTNGSTYSYTLVAVDNQGARTTLQTVEATPQSAVAATVTEYALYQNYPNPFNPSTTIAFDLPEAGLVSLNVYNTVGQQVATLVNSTLAVGRHTVTFDAADLPSGLYLYTITSGTFTATQKMLLVK